MSDRQNAPDDCFPYLTRLQRADGRSVKIGKVVNQRLPVEVMTFDPVNHQVVPRRVTG